MFRGLLFAWATVVVAQVMAQVKDTVRENIDYRYFKNISVKESSERAANRKVKDTIWQKIDYRQNYYSFLEAKRYKQPSNLSHYVSIQVGQLLLRAFGANFSSPNLDNPFEVTYSVNNRYTGYGFGF